MKKFDFCIGNPPYQEETEANSQSNGQNPRTNIFQYFQAEADKITTISSVMIYPGGRWIQQFGKGCKEFGKTQINDPSLKRIDFYPDSKEVFGQAADLSDGISVVIKTKRKTNAGFDYNYVEHGVPYSIHAQNPGDDLMPLNPRHLAIITKTDRFIKENALSTMDMRILPRTLFGIESDFVEKNPDKVRLYNPSEKIDFTKEVKILTNDKAGKAGRAKWYVTSLSNLRGKEKHIAEWQVAVSSANAGGQKRDNQIEIIDNHSAFGRSRVALGSFKTKEEAENFYSYCCSPLIRFLFLMTDESLSSLGKKVVDVLDYSNKSIIDFQSSINDQLFELIQLTDSERAYVLEVVSQIDKKRGKEM